MALTDLVQEMFSAAGRGLLRGLLGAEESGLSPGTAPVRPSGPLRPGDLVFYRQGRGRFLARVVSVHGRSGKAVVKRSSDGKRLSRPLHKLERR